MLVSDDIIQYIKSVHKTPNSSETTFLHDYYKNYRDIITDTATIIESDGVRYKSLVKELTEDLMNLERKKYNRYIHQYKYLNTECRNLFITNATLHIE